MEILKYPDPRLKREAARVEEFGEEVEKLIEDMYETMYAAPGVGLAATQVDVALKLAVLDVSSVVEGVEPFVLINPEIVTFEGEEEGEEGCLSVPDFTSMVKRAKKISLNYSGRDGRPLEMEAEGFLARAIQHETDHLNGILFVDRLSPLKKDIFRRKYQKMKRAGTQG